MPSVEFDRKERMEVISDGRHPEIMTTQDQYWKAVERHDRTFDGRFYFGVVTTGVFCRPSCPSRRPLRKNVRFYETPADAERDGLRACLRCKPLEDPGAKIRDLCRYIEDRPDERHDLAALAARTGVSRFHLQRTFKAAVGLTPKQYVEACRLRRLKESLRESKDVTDAVYDAGFGSPSRVYEHSDERLGMTPRQYRKHGEGVAIAHVVASTPLGLMMLGATERGLCFLQFGESEEELLDMLRREFPAAELQPMDARRRPEFRRWIDALMHYLKGSRQQLDLPLDVRGTAFQKRVWAYLQSIPHGEVRSYGEVAAAIGRPSAHRAVAQACAGNRVALAIPCHRVIRGTGALGGYRWGLERKRALLDGERD